MPALAVPLIAAGISYGVSAGLNALTRRKTKPQPLERGRNDDLRVTSSDFGATLPWVKGTVRLAPQILYSTGIRVEQVVTNEPVQGGGGGGKGGGGRQTQSVTTYNYYTSLFLAACANQIRSIPKLWANSEIKYNFAPDPNLFYFEAEDGILSGGALVAADAGASSGYKVTNIGNGGKLKFNLPAPSTPSDPSTEIYTNVTVYYKTPTAKNLFLSVNGAAPASYAFPASGADVQTKTIRIDGLHPAQIEFSNPSASAPDIDRITVWYSYIDLNPIGLPVTGISDPYIGYPLDPENPYSRYNYRPVKDASGLYSFSTPFTSDVRVYTGTETQVPDPAIVADLDKRFGAGQGIGYASGFRGLAGIMLADHHIPSGGLENFTMEVDEGTTAVSSILRDLYQIKNIDQTELDLSALAGLTRRGIVVHQQTSVEAVIKYFEDWYQFKMVEADGKIRAVLRGGSPIAVITEADLCERGEGKFDVEITDVSEESLPRELWVNHLNPENGIDYKNDSQAARVFASTAADDSVTLSFPFVAEASEAKAVAEKILFRAHAERKKYDFYLMPEYAKYTPGDVLELQLKNQTHLIEIDKIQTALFGKVHINAHSTGEIAISEAVNTIPTVADLLKDAAKFPANVALFAFESEPVELTHEGLGIYAACSRRGSGKYTGANLYGKLQSGEDYKLFDTFTLPAGIGLAQSALPDNAGNAEDTVHSLTIYFYEEVELESIGADEIAARPTINLIRVGGEWLQYRTAVAASVPSNSYFRSAWTISNLSRGKFNTSAAKASHAAGDKCLIYSPAVHFVKLDAVYKDENVTLTAPGFGQLIEMATPQNLVVSGLSIGGQYSPIDLPGRIGLGKPKLAQFSDATNTTVVLRVTEYPANAKVRKIRVSANADMSGATESKDYAANYANDQLPETFVYSKASESAAVHRYYEVSHSVNDADFSDASDVLNITFADAGGAGGSGGAGGGTIATPPTMSAPSFNPANDTVTVAVSNVTGTGTLRLLRQSGSGDFSEVANGAANSATLSDIPQLDGTYKYKIAQDGISGFSNEETITVDVDEPIGTSAPPSNASGQYFNDFGGSRIDLSAQINGTGSTLIERRYGSSGSYEQVVSLMPGVGTYQDFELTTWGIYYYRFSDSLAPGYATVSVSVTRNAFLYGT